MSMPAVLSKMTMLIIIEGAPQNFCVAVRVVEKYITKRQHIVFGAGALIAVARRQDLTDELLKYMLLQNRLHNFVLEPYVYVELLLTYLQYSSHGTAVSAILHSDHCITSNLISKDALLNAIFHSTDRSLVAIMQYLDSMYLEAHGLTPRDFVAKAMEVDHQVAIAFLTHVLPVMNI